MKRYVEGEARSQTTLFPDTLDDYIAEDNPVRVVDVFVDELDLKKLGFDGMVPEATGRPAYHLVVLCRNLNLFSDALVAIDGSKFKAVNNRDKNFTDRKRKARMQQLEQSTARYLAELDRADREPSILPEARVAHLQEKVAAVRAQMRQLKRIGKQMASATDGQISLTDPDARSMATTGRGTGIVGYNVQTAVD